MEKMNAYLCITWEMITLVCLLQLQTVQLFNTVSNPVCLWPVLLQELKVLFQIAVCALKENFRFHCQSFLFNASSSLHLSMLL